MDTAQILDGVPNPHRTAHNIAIAIQDPINSRLMEAVSLQLDLTPILLAPDKFVLDNLPSYELIVADEPVARFIRASLALREAGGEGPLPAVVAVVPAPLQDAGPAENTESYEGLLALPQPPAVIAAQLGLILYAHRNYTRRFRGAFEELQLNRRIFRSVTSGISIADARLPDMPLVYVNPAFEVITGYSMEEVQGKNCRFLQGSETNQPAIEQLRKAIREEREILVLVRNFRKDGTAFWNELSLSPIRNREGQLTHFVGIQTDVSARVEFEDALRESEKLAAVGRLASSIAHEINNPLESVMNLIYLAERAEDPTDLQEYLATADRELQRVKLITAQSLRFYKQSTKPQAIGGTELLSSVLDLYHSRFANSRINLHRRDRSSDSIICMESEIRQVLHNLVINAIDAMHGTGGHLFLRTRKATEHRTGGKGLQITVADTGSGIDPEIVKDIYRAFYTTKGIRGSGLGLWISSEIVQRHKGRLRVRSRNTGPCTGTVFQLFLPHQGLAA